MTEMEKATVRVPRMISTDMGACPAYDQLALVLLLIIHESRSISAFQMFQSFDYFQLSVQLVFFQL